MAADSNPCSDILTTNFFSSSFACVYTYTKIGLARNGGRRMVFSAAQSRGFLELERSLATARKRVLPGPVKLRLELIDTTVGSSSYPSRKKAVTIFLRDLFKIDAWPQATLIYPSDVLLVSISRLRKYMHTRLNLDLTGSSKRISYWIK